MRIYKVEVWLALASAVDGDIFQVIFWSYGSLNATGMTAGRFYGREATESRSAMLRLTADTTAIDCGE